MMLGEPCRYITPCGWCWKWDKKCDQKIVNCSPSVPMPEDQAQKFVDQIKSGELPPIDIGSNWGLQMLYEMKGGQYEYKENQND